MYEQMAIDRISEVENLTDNLDDETASWLIRWAIDKAPSLLADVTDEDEAGAKINSLMAVMRRINEIVPALSAKKPAELATDLKELAKLHAEAFDSAKKPNAKDFADSTTKVLKQPPLEAIQSMLTLIAPPTDSPAKAGKSRK
jgi:hypothetical protein